MNDIKRCLVCGNLLFEEPLMELSNMPSSAQNIPSKEGLAADEGISLRLCQCSGCGLVQLDCEPVDYYKDVIRSGGFTTTMIELRRRQYKNLIEKYHLENKKFIEVGCGQGEFLSVLTEFPVEAFGIENKRELVDIAAEKGLNVSCGFIGNETDKLSNGLFDVFLSFNFFEHQPNPNGMLRGIYNNLTDEGMGLITVPSLEYILENDGYYELIRDHIAYYTFDTLRFALEKNGFQVLEHETINRDTISVIVRKKKRTDISKIKSEYEIICTQINDYVNSLLQQGKSVAVWGASHQGFTLLSTAGLSGKIKYIIDSAPFKQNKYAPASHIPIISPAQAKDDQTDAIIIAAPGYTNEIASIIKNEFKEGIDIAVIMTNKLQKYEEI